MLFWTIDPDFKSYHKKLWMLSDHYQSNIHHPTHRIDVMRFWWRWNCWWWWQSMLVLLVPQWKSFNGCSKLFSFFSEPFRHVFWWRWCCWWWCCCCWYSSGNLSTVARWEWCSIFDKVQPIKLICVLRRKSNNILVRNMKIFANLNITTLLNVWQIYLCPQQKILWYFQGGQITQRKYISKHLKGRFKGMFPWLTDSMTP